MLCNQTRLPLRIMTLHPEAYTWGGKDRSARWINFTTDGQPIGKNCLITVWRKHSQWHCTNHKRSFLNISHGERVPPGIHSAWKILHGQQDTGDNPVIIRSDEMFRKWPIPVREWTSEFLYVWTLREYYNSGVYIVRTVAVSLEKAWVSSWMYRTRLIFGSHQPNLQTSQWSPILTNMNKVKHAACHFMLKKVCEENGQVIGEDEREIESS